MRGKPYSPPSGRWLLAARSASASFAFCSKKSSNVSSHPGNLSYLREKA